MNKIENSKIMLILSVLLIFLVIGAASAADDNLANETVSTSNNNDDVDTLTESVSVDEKVSTSDESDVDALTESVSVDEKVSTTESDIDLAANNTTKQEKEEILGLSNEDDVLKASANVTTFADLKTQISASGVTEINITADLTANSDLNINKAGLIINGNGHKLNGNGARSINIGGNNVEIRNLTITGYSVTDASRNLIYISGSGVKLINVNIRSCSIIVGSQQRKHNSYSYTQRILYWTGSNGYFSGDFVSNSAKMGLRIKTETWGGTKTSTINQRTIEWTGPNGCISGKISGNSIWLGPRHGGNY